MTDNKQFVTTRYPEAWCTKWTGGVFKIYADHAAFIALSGSCASEDGAWSDAADAIRERDAAQAKKG
jgi:hypothetical protein